MSSRTEIHITTSNKGLVATLGEKALNHPKVRIGLVLWALGLFLMFLAPAPMPTTKEQIQQYEDKMVEAATLDGYKETLRDLRLARMDTEAEKFWFWRFYSDARAKVYAKQEKVDVLEKKIAVFERKQDELMREAKHSIGLWSEFGLGEARTKFWDSFEAGKLFAQRQTFWDMILSLMTTREDNILGILFNWLLTALINFTFALFGCLIYYMFALGSLIASYQPDPITAVVFFALGLLGASSVVVGYLTGLYGMGAGTVYMVGRLALNDARLRAEERRRLHHHYD